MKRILSILTAAVFLIPAAQAGFDLPDGAFRTGMAYHRGDTFYADISFAVYDTADAGLTLGIDVPDASKQFLYAYQISHTAAMPDVVIEQFSLVGLGSQAIAALSQVGHASVEDGVDPDGTAINADNTILTFTFAGGVFVVGEKSALLLLSSDYLPTVGSYTFTAPDDDSVLLPGDESPGNNIPEPATLMLLLSGGALLGLRKRQ